MELGTIKGGKELGLSSHNKHIWHACISCGKERWVRLNNGIPRFQLCMSCSLSFGVRCDSSNAYFKHGDAKTHNQTKLYMIWAGMKGRCTNPNSSKYERYGERGISVCDKWMKDFRPFKNWALKNGYQEGLSIDRIDNDGNYCPENCQWITLSDNTRKRFVGT